MWPARSSNDRAVVEETWDAILIGNDKVGYEYTVIRPIRETGRELAQIRVLFSRGLVDEMHNNEIGNEVTLVKRFKARRPLDQN